MSSIDGSLGRTTEERLVARARTLIDIPSVSGNETEVLAAVRESLPPDLDLLDDRDAVLFAVTRSGGGRPFVVLAGHVDTVPIADNVPSTMQDGAILGRGAADMKGAVAVMLELAHLRSGIDADVDVGFLFFGREELPFGHSALLPLFERCPAARTPDLAIVMEPTDNAIEIGCLGNLNATVAVRGRAAHSARPWLGDNAIHRAIGALAPLADLPAREVTIDGFTYREVVSITTIEGGAAANVVPDRVEARVNYRYAPGHTPEDAEARLRELLAVPEVELRIDGNAPPGPVGAANPLVAALREAGDLPVRAKQAWTPVAEFATVGVDAVNFGPGDPRYAHRDDERVEVRSLELSLEILTTFLGLEHVSSRRGR